MSEKSKRIKYWEEMLVVFKEQAGRAYVKPSDYIPLWLGASNQDCVELIKDELKLLKAEPQRSEE